MAGFSLFGLGTRAGERISPREVKERMDAGEKFLLLDVRTPQEYHAGHIPGSTLLPLDSLDRKISGMAPSKDAPIVLYCQSGARASAAARELHAMGYTDVRNLGGIFSWPYGITDR